LLVIQQYALCAVELWAFVDRMPTFRIPVPATLGLTETAAAYALALLEVDCHSTL
jgi:hypothetical protein